MRDVTSAVIAVVCAAAALTVVQVPNANAFPTYIGQVPNGFTVGCATCHINPAGAGPRNAFGQEVHDGFLSGPAATGNVVWGRDLARLDSDGDGFTNGEELQDPAGFWRTGNPFPGTASLVSNPGDRSSVPSITLNHPESGVMHATCSINNTGGRADMVVRVENQAGEMLESLTPSGLQAANTGTASIFFQTNPRPLRQLLPRKTATFRWKGLLFGDGFLDLWLEVTARFDNGDITTTGTVNCNRLAVGNPGQAAPAPTRTAARPSTQRPTATQPESNLRPTRTARPTRTPIAARPTRTARLAAPTSTSRPTRTPIAARPTRTRIPSRPTRTPIAMRATRTRLPTSTPRPTRTPHIAPPTSTPAGRSDAGSENPSSQHGLRASCSLRQTIDLVSITLLVENRSDHSVRNLAAGSLNLEPEGGSLFFDRAGPSPRTHSLVRNGSSATFRWTGRLSDGGTMGFGASATGTTTDGQVLDTGLVDCGVAALESQSFDSSRFSGSCSIAPDEANGRVTFKVTNGSGTPVTDVVPSFGTVTSTGSAQVLNLRGPGPRSARRLADGQQAEFLWRARMLGRGQVSIQVEAKATTPNRQRVSTGPVECSLALGSAGGDLPDLTIDERDLRESIVIENATFGPQHCAVVDRCVEAAGERRLLRFDTTAPNLGPADLFIGDPRRSPLTTFSQCLDWYVLEEYADYRLLDLQGNLVARGHKEAFCLIDHDRMEPDARSTPQFNDCGFQGISAGWADVYSRGLDCQWVDITGVPEDHYVLEVQVNPARVIEEADYSNNVGRTEVFIPSESSR